MSQNPGTERWGQKQPRHSPNTDVKAAKDLERELAETQAQLAEARDRIKRLEQQLADARRKAAEKRNAERQVAKLSKELQRQELQIERELEIAREFQTRLIPARLPEIDGIHVAAKYLATDRVGGDLYDVFGMGNSCLGVFVADVSGHGLPAAFVTTMTKTALDGYRANQYSPKAILEQINRDLCESTLETHFATAFLAVLDCETLKMKFVNSSHSCPVLYSEGKFEVLDAEGHVLGMFEEPEYEEKEIQLHEGDRILFYTDGLTEAFNAAGDPYGCQRLLDVVRENVKSGGQAIIDKVLEDMRNHLDGQATEDDLTLVALELVPKEAKEHRIEIPSEPMQLSRVESLIIPRLEEMNYGERAIFAVRLALEEAVINAMKHGNHMDKAKRVVITFSANPQELAINVEDEGDGFDPDAVPDPTLDENLEVPHGRGLVLMRAYMDDVVYSPKGNKVTIIKRAPWTD